MVQPISGGAPHDRRIEHGQPLSQQQKDEINLSMTAIFFIIDRPHPDYKLAEGSLEQLKSLIQGMINEKPPLIRT